jgi:hypothetical protein
VSEVTKKLNADLGHLADHEFETHLRHACVFVFLCVALSRLAGGIAKSRIPVQGVLPNNQKFSKS